MSKEIRLMINKVKNFENFLNEQINYDLLVEASKLKIMTDKEGLNPNQAKILDELCGSLSLWMLNKLKEYQKSLFKSWEPDVNIDKVTIEYINDNKKINTWKEVIQSIMDWIRVGLNGNVKQYKDLSLIELNSKAKEWHDSLDIGEGSINYIEKHPIIIDFRDKDGNGFYWASLETKQSDEECKRMGHCGRSSYGSLYSLREVKRINNNFTLNKSHLTAAIDDEDGTLYQLKGPKNSKPSSKYHDYILPLFYKKVDDGEYYIEGLGSEYESRLDFKLTDLPNSVIIELYEKRPELFKGRSLQKKLMNLGLIEKKDINYILYLTISAKDIEDYVEGNSVTGRGTKPNGEKYKRTLFEDILSSSLDFDYVPDYDSDMLDWINNENSEEINQLLRNNAIEDNFNMDEFDEIDLNEKIEEFDSSGEIKSAIEIAMSDSMRDDELDYYFNKLKECLEELGDVEEISDTYVKLKINMEAILDDDSNEEIIDDCDEDLECIFNYCIKNEIIEKPNFYIDSRWSPSGEEESFNEHLEYRLSEINS
jgi:hypothetical protein